MSLTRLAGARSSSGFLAKRILPSGSSRRTASAVSAGGRPSAARRADWAVAAKGTTAAANTARTASIRPGCTAFDFSDRSKRAARKNRSADRLLQLFRRLEAWDAPGDRHRLARAGVLQGARLASRDRECSESDQRDRIAPLQGGSDTSERGPERALGAGLGPARRRCHPRDDIGFGHFGYIPNAPRASSITVSSMVA